MSTYANGTQQTYQQIWVGMEPVCAGLMAAMRRGAPETVATAPLDVVVVAARPAALDWPDLRYGRPRWKHPLHRSHRSARGRRRLALRVR